MLASDFDTSRFLKSEDNPFDKKYRNKEVTAETLERNGKPEKRLVLWFTGTTKGLVLNKTNLRVLKGAFGDDTDDWIGKVIAIFPMTVPFEGRMTQGLRVRIPPPKNAAAAVAPVRPTPGNGAATPVAAPQTHDNELEEDAVSYGQGESDDEDSIPF